MAAAAANPGRESARLPALDGLRGIAILLVLLHHLSEDAVNDASIGTVARFFATQGPAGADLFFVLSGFLITGILLDSQRERAFFMSFYARRALRIFPLYDGVLFAFFVVEPLGAHLVGRHAPALAHSPAWLWLYAFNGLLSKLGSWDVGPGLGLMLPFWSLSVEEHFYLVWPFLIRRTPARFLGWLFGIVIVTATALRWRWSGHSPPPLIVDVFTPFRMDSLALGALAAWIRRLGLPRIRLNRVATAFVIAAAVATVAMVLPAWNPSRSPAAHGIAFWRYTILGVLSASVILKSVTAWQTDAINRALSARWLRLLGRYSYGLYIYNFIVIGLLTGVIGRRVGKILHAPLASILVTKAVLLGACLTIAIVSWHVVERPILRLKRYFPSPSSPLGPL